MRIKAIWIWISILIVFTFLILFLFSLPFLHIGVYVSALDNPYVNTRYSGWKSVWLEELCITIPEDWSLVANDAACFLVDTDNHIVALGEKRIHSDTFAKDTIQEHYRLEIAFKTIETRDVMKWNYANCCKWNVMFSNGESAAPIILLLPYHYDYEYIFVFFPEADEFQDIYNKTEAIAWSMTYRNEMPGFLEQRALHLR